MLFYCLLAVWALTILAYGKDEVCKGRKIQERDWWRSEIEAALLKECPDKKKNLTYSFKLECILTQEYASKDYRKRQLVSHWNVHYTSDDGKSSVPKLMKDLKTETYDWWKRWPKGDHRLCESARSTKNKYYACAQYNRKEGYWLNDNKFGCVFHYHEEE